MVTHVMALEQLGQALELLRERTALKVILRP
jgi:threonine dehydrogenase-like Zn-dependent dehydrogenase